MITTVILSALVLLLLAVLVAGVLWHRRNNKPRVRFNWAIGLVQPKQAHGGQHVLEIQITNEQKVNVTLTPVTATGKPAKLDGAPTWTVQSGDSTVVVAPDGMSADLVSSDTPGDTEVLVEADADLGAGVVTVSDIVRLTVAGALAANLGLSAGTPVPK